MEKAKRLLEEITKEWELRVPTNDPYYVEAYRGVVIDEYVLVTTYHPSISVTDIYNDNGELVFQYVDDEYDEISAYEYITGKKAMPTLLIELK